MQTVDDDVFVLVAGKYILPITISDIQQRKANEINAIGVVEFIVAVHARIYHC